MDDIFLSVRNVYGASTSFRSPAKINKSAIRLVQDSGTSGFRGVEHEHATVNSYGG